VQENITVKTNKTVTLFDARSAVDIMTSPALLNSSGSLDIKSSESVTPNTPKAVTIKNASGITDDRKKYTHAPATVVNRFSPRYFITAFTLSFNIQKQSAYLQTVYAFLVVNLHFLGINLSVNFLVLILVEKISTASGNRRRTRSNAHL